MIDQGAYFQREGGRVRTRSSAPDSSASPDDDVTAEALLAHVPSSTAGALFVRTRIGEALFAVGSSVAYAYKARVDNGVDPTNRTAAMRANEKGWTAAESDELANHRTNRSWSEIDRSQVPHGRRLVKLVWVYKVKRSGKLKARLCVQGCTQIPGVDYQQTFCATMRPTSLRALCALAASRDMHMHRWDFVSAYLQGELLEDEVVYCHMPPGYDKARGTDNRPRVCRIEKPVYGMAQAGRRWQRTIFPWLRSQGLEACHHDSCVFHRSVTRQTPDGPRDELFIVGVYVDDLFCVASHTDEHSAYHEFTSALQEHWDVEDEGPVSDLLNVEITREGDSVVLRQTAYIDKLVGIHAPDGIPASHQSTKTPCDEDIRQMIADALSFKDDVDPALLRRYQALVGALLYCATNTRPDIAYAIAMLCRAMSCPTEELYEAALRVLYYLHRHRELGLRYEGDEIPMHGYTDSDWDVKHSTSGFVFTLHRAAISWGSKKQTSVALSSCEAELMASSEAGKEAVYLRSFLEELGVGHEAPTSMGMDNQAGRELAYNPEHHAKTKHIQRRHFFVRELVEDFRVTVPFVRSQDNDADFFTKPLKSSQFFPMRDRIMNMP